MIDRLNSMGALIKPPGYWDEEDSLYAYMASDVPIEEKLRHIINK